MMFARGGVRILIVFSCFLIAAQFCSNVYTAPKWDTQEAARAFEDALQQLIRIEQSTQSSRDQYLQCAKTFRKVYISDPHYTHAGDAVYEEALVYQKMGEKFGNSEYFNTAVTRFEFLVSDYGGNPNCPDSLLRIASIYSDILKNEVAAENAYQRLRTRYKHSKPAVPMAKVQAITEKPTQQLPAAIEPTPNISAKTAIIHGIRYFSNSESSRIVIDLDNEITYHKARLTRPERIYFDISNASLSANFFNRLIPVESEHLSAIRVSPNRSNVIRVVLDVASSIDYSVTELRDPFRIVIDLRRRGMATKAIPIFQDSRQNSIDPRSSKPPEQGAVNRNSAIKTKKSEPQSSPPLTVRLPLPEAEKRQVPKAITQIGIVSANEGKDPGPSTPVHSADASNSAAKQNIEMQPEPPLIANSNPPIAPDRITEILQSPLPSKSSVDTRTIPKKETKPEQAPSKAKLLDQKAVDLNPEMAKIPPTNAGEVFSLPKTAPSTSRGDRTLTRMLGLKIGRIVIDPGHGGHDLGTIGPKGLAEKTLTLAIARELQTLLQDELGANVILTRTEDVYVPLEERTSLANQHRADLFLSIHANSSKSRSISGVETYYLDFAKTNAEREIAARENATSDRNVSDLEDLLKKIVQADKSAESRELASIIQKQLFSGAKKLFPSTHNRGVRSAPFVVLIGANMPSILAEVAFISNPRDERLLNKKANQRTLAKALFSGIVGYMETLGSDLAHIQSILNK